MNLGSHVVHAQSSFTLEHGSCLHAHLSVSLSVANVMKVMLA